MREIRTPRSVGTGGGRPPPVTRWVWKRSYGRPTKAPPDERGGNRHGRPKTTAPHPDSTNACRFARREHPRPLALARPAIPPSPLSDRVGYSDHVRFRGYLPVHWCSGLQPPCLRFAAAVTGRHARLGTRLLARLCRRRHLRRLSSTRLQGATLTDPDLTLSRHPARATERRLPPPVENWSSSCCQLAHSQRR